MPGPVLRKAIGVVQLTAAVGVTGVLVAAVFLPVTGGIGLAARNSVRAFDEQPCDVEAGVPEQASTMYAADGSVIATFYSQNRTVVPTNKIPKVMRQAIVAIEDRRFYEHHGVDPEALVRAVVKNQQAGDTVQGGSTLTMQYIKNVRLYQAKTLEEQRAAVDKSNGRKLIEARCALELENKQTKDQILTNYLNITYFGAGAYGVEKAAQTYFGKHALKLTVPEAAMLAGLVQSPIRYDPYKSKKDAKARRDLVLGDMQSLGYITAKQAAAAKASPVKPVTKAKSSNKDCANTNTKIVNAGFFCDYAKLALKAAGFPQERLETGGLKIYTTLKPNIQNSVQGAMPFGDWVNKKSIAVTDILDPRTGNVLAFGVARKYGVDPKNRNVTSNPLNTKPVAGAGSTYKMFTLVSALQNKVPLRAFQIPVANSYTSQNCVTYSQGNKEPYTVRNAGHYREGPWDLEDATAASVNTFFVALLDQRFNCDLSGPVKVAQSMGMEVTLGSKFDPKKKDSPTIAEDYIGGKKASFTLGPNATSPLELASAYGTLANDGKYCPPTPLVKVLGPDGKPIGLPEHACSQRVAPGIARTVNEVLEKDTNSGLGTATSAFGGLASSSRPIGGKTGTASGYTQADLARGDGVANGNSAAWFVGYTPEYAGSTSVFNPTNPKLALEDVPNINRSVFGAYSAGIWRRGMEPFLGNHTWSFPPADPEVINGDSVPVQSVVGMDPASATGVLQAGGFQVQIAPEQKDSPEPAGSVAAQSPSGRAARGMMITLYLSNGKGAPAAGGLPLPPGQTLPAPPPGRGGGGGRGGGRGGGG